jgi:hypothetical protein
MSKITTLSGLIGTNGDLTVDTDTLHVDSTNNRVGIGTTLPSAPLHIVNSSLPRIEMGYGGGSNADHRIAWDSAGLLLSADQNNQSSGSSYISMLVDGSERMRLEADGDLHVDGNVVAYSTTISDIRLKKDIAPIEDAVTKVQQLNGCTFTYLKDDRKSAGLIAQDVEKVLPSAVIEDEAVFHGEEGETYKTVQYDQVIGLLVEAVKELKAEIEELKNGSSN